MVFVYPNTICVFTGNEETARKVGYVEVDEETYNDLMSGKKVWKNGKIVDNPDVENTEE